jgi:diguanylate cyclase (GGDEF)-like protein/PAS domain S-box-containing protein
MDRPADSPPDDRGHDRDRWLLTRRAEVLYRQGPLALGMSVLVAALLAVPLAPVIGGVRPWGWLGAMVAVLLLRWWTVRRWAARGPSVGDPRRWIRRYLAGVAVAGAVWGSAAWVLYPAGSPLHQALLFTVLVGVAAGSLALLSGTPWGFPLFGALVLLPLVARLAFERDLVHGALAGVLMVFFGGLAVVAGRFQGIVTASYELRLDKLDLVRRLTASNRGLRGEIARREAANAELVQREAVLEAVAYAAARLLGARSWQEEIDEILSRLGEAAAVSRVYLFALSPRPDGGAVATRLHEWAAPGVARQIDDPDQRSLPVAEAGFGEAVARLGAGATIAGPIDGLEPRARRWLEAQGIRSLALVPIPVGGELWGFLGFDDCADAREWSRAELDALRTAADILAAALRGLQAEEGRRESEERFRLLAEHTSDLVCLHEPDGRYLYVSPSCHALLGYRPEELLGRDPYEFLAPEDRERVRRDHHEPVLDRAETQVVTYRFRRAGGDYVWLETVTEPVPGAGGEVARLVTSSRDVTERRRAQEQLFYEKELAQVTLQSIGEGVITTDAAGLIDYLNPVAEKLTGWQLGTAAGRPLDEVFHLVDEVEHRPIEGLAGEVLRGDGGPALPEHAALVGPGGREFAIEATAAPIRDRAGRTVGTVFVFRDVTKTRELAQQLSYQASHDPLTGLINRRELEARLGQSLEPARSGAGAAGGAGGGDHGPPGEAAEAGESAAAEPAAPAATDPAYAADVLCYLDLDQFKVVNDTCGHVAGDEFLRRLASLLRGRVRRTDTLARLGGDEFGILLRSCPLEQAVVLARDIGRAIRDFRFHWQGRVFAVGASIGVVAVGAEFEDVADVLRAADSACYAAKERGRNRVHVYQRDDRDVARRHGEMQWLSRLHDALAADRFELYGQPILAAGSGEPRHFEILVSLRDREGRRVPPDIFIPAAERYNLMPAIDRWVVRSIFARMPRAWWERDGGACFINLSGTSLVDETFLRFVEEQLARHQVPPTAVCFEITETAAIANLAEATRFMHRLKELGCRFALDDFGSGLSSFAHLRALPVDFLKIDGEFVRDIESDPVDYAMVEAINRIGHLLGLETIAEYVESEAILARVTALGVDLVQGFALGRPRPVAELAAVVS